MTAVIAALPREVAGLVRGVRPQTGLTAKGVFVYRLPGTLVVCAGMGTERVTLAVKVAMEAGRVSTLVSAGLAGGCDPLLAVGTVAEAGCVVDALSGARFAGLPGEAMLVTTHTIAGVSEKRRLYKSYGAGLVDMEAAAVARLAGMHGVAFRAVKAVSDAHDFELSSLSRFASPHGHFRISAFALHTALRPGMWRKTIRLGTGSQRALRALTERLKEITA